MTDEIESPPARSEAQSTSAHPRRWLRKERSWLRLFIVAGLGLALSSAVSSFVTHHWDYRARQIALDAIGENHKLLLQTSLTDVEQAICSVAAFLEASSHKPDMGEFDHFVSRIISSYPSTLEIAWAPRWQSHGEGGSQFVIQHVSGTRGLSDLGADIGLDPAELKLIESVPDNTAVSTPVGTFTTANGEGLFVIVPVIETPPELASVNADRILGLVRAQVVPKEIVDHSLGHVADEVEAALFSRNSGPRGLPFAAHTSAGRRERLLALRRGELEAGPHWSGDVSFAGRHWTLIVAPTPDSPLINEYDHGRSVFVIGLLLTAMLVGYLGLSGRYGSKLAFANILLNATTEASPDGILAVDPRGRIITFNRRFVEMWKIPAEMINAGLSKPMLRYVLTFVADEKHFMKRIRYLYDRPDEACHEDIDLKDGRVFDRQTAALYDVKRHYLGRVWFYRDITESRAAELRIARLALTDSLTGLGNRVSFLQRVEQAVATQRRGGASFAVFYCDLDHFKDVNDTLGHGAGDDLLRQAGKRLTSAVREMDNTARLGGDEFAILQPNVTDLTAVGVFAQRLIDVLSELYRIGTQNISVTASIGVSINDDMSDAETILRRADLALYQAKDDGRNTFRVHTDEMDRTVHERVAIAEALRIGVPKRQLLAHYQPQIDARDGRITGVEALVRWNHPERGLLMPGEFMQVARATGLIRLIDAWVLNEACQQMRAWIDGGIAPPTIAVNLSPIEFKTPNLEQEIFTTMERYKIPPDRLELEITEAVLMQVSDTRDDILARLKAHGIRISIDDFGTGYSSLAYIKRIRPNRIKIAAEFVRDMLTDEADRAVVRATIEMANELHITLVAEGVETTAQARFLSELGCYDLQGFAYSRPVPADEVTRLLEAGRLFSLSEWPSRITVVA